MATLYQLADGCARAERESAEYPHTIGPILGANFLSWVLPSASLGDGSSTQPTALWIDNSEMAAVIEVLFIYNEYIWEKSTDELQAQE